MNCMDELMKLINNYSEQYHNAPRFGGYSKLLRKKIESKSQVQAAFLDNLLEVQILCDDPVTTDKIDKLISKYENR